MKKVIFAVIVFAILVSALVVLRPSSKLEDSNNSFAESQKEDELVKIVEEVEQEKEKKLFCQKNLLKQKLKMKLFLKMRVTQL